VSVRGPVQPRAGHTALPNLLLARALAELPPEQFRLLVGLFVEAEFKSEGTTTPDGRWRVGFGQILVSYSGLAERYGMTVDGVRWALRRFRDLGISTRPAARPNESTGQNDKDPTRRHTNRPNVVDLGDWAAFLGEPSPNTKQNTKRTAGNDASHHAQIQHGNTGTQNTEKLAPGSTTSPAADDSPPKRLEILNLTVGLPPLPKPGPGPFERVVGHWFAAWERAGRGKHSALTQAEGATLKRLVRQFGPDELAARMDRALADPWFVERGDLMLFARQRERYARPGRPGPVAALPASLPDPGCEPWGKLRGWLRERLRGETFDKFFADPVGRMDGSALVLSGRDRFHTAMLDDNYRTFLTETVQELGIASEVRIEAAGGAA
jgi:hypothetical protein